MAGARGHPHLPSGRPPGPQSKRRGGAFGAMGISLGISGLVVAGLGVALIGTSTVGAAVMIGMGLVVLGAVPLLARRGRGRWHRAKGLAVEAAPEVTRRGETIEVRLGAVPSGIAEAELGLVCIERYDYNQTVQTQNGSSTVRKMGEVAAHEEWAPVGGAGDGHRFDVPADAPYSYEGKCISFAWRVSARCRNADGDMKRTDEPIWVEA